ncbi:hypothetical protein OIV83_005601 [Microbotryomycetes sp. JL201]|nr:hypothetical protein OIV83_005601 [Microbotryomycetes sp. JL201]
MASKIKADDPSLLPSDSEDEDFVPDMHARDDDRSSDEDDDDDERDEDGRPLKRRKHASHEGNKDDDKQASQLSKEAVDDLWASFNAEPSPYASGSTTNLPSEPSKPRKRMMTITVRYEFAGKVVEQEKQVEHDSEEAKNWLATQKQTQPKPSHQTAAASTDATTNSIENQMAFSQSEHHPATSETATPESAVLPPPPAAKPAGRRPKPSGGLNALAAQLKKPAKLNTLEKSKLDWNKFVSKEEGLADTLSQSRKNGYLDKQDFLDKAQQAKDAAWEQSKSTRRR